MKILLLILGLVFSTTVLAGHPLQDPVVHGLRSQFEVAQTPTLQDLRLGEDIYCIVHAAQLDIFDKFENQSMFKFRKALGFIVNDGVSAVSSYAIGEKGLSGVYTDGTYNYIGTIRVAESGDLIGEWAVASKAPSKEGRAISLVNSSYYVNAYAICPREEN